METNFSEILDCWSKAACGEIDYVCEYDPVRSHKYDAGFDLRLTHACDPATIFTPSSRTDVFSYEGLKLSDLEPGYDYVIFTPGESILLATGFYCSPLPYTYHEIVPRSSLSRTGLMLPNSVGVVDSGYEGEYFVRLVNSSDRLVALPIGDRIVQVIVHPIFTPRLNKVDGLEARSTRGAGGFGSTGRA